MSRAATVAVLVGAAGLLLGLRPSLGVNGPHPGMAFRGLLLASGLTTMMLTLSGTALALGLIVAASALDVFRRLRRRRHRADAVRTRSLVLAACESIAADLRAGSPPGAALAGGARTWPALLPVAHAVALGGDAAPRLRRLATEPGAEQVVVLAAAWSLAHRAGSGLADAVELAVRTLREELALAELIGTEIAAARATALLLAVLPAAVLALGQGLGGSPVAFLLATPAGLGCLAVGLALTHGGLAWLDAIADGTAR